MTTGRRHRSRRRLACVAALLVTIVVCFGGTAASAPSQSLTTININTLPIANALPMTLGIQKGFFAAQGIEMKSTILQSGNDIVLAMANSKGDIGYIGYVPAMIGRTQGIPITIIAASETEGTSEADNWQNIMVKGSSSIRTPADLAGKTVALNALKGVGEVAVRAALDKVGVDSDSVKYVALPFPTMRSALANGQVDAVWTPEPFMSQILSDGGRIVMAPGPVLGRYFPNGGYAARNDWVKKNPGLAARFRAAINQSLVYANTHPDEIRALLPAATRNIRLANWSPLIDRVQLLKLAKYAKQYGAISTLPNFTQLFPSYIEGGKTLAGHRRRGVVPDSAAGRQEHLGAEGRQVQRQRHRQIREGQLPSSGTGRREVDERPEEGGSHLDAQPEEGCVPIRVRRELEAEGFVPGQVGRSNRAAGRKSPAAPHS